MDKRNTETNVLGVSFDQVEAEFLDTPELVEEYEKRTAAAEAANIIHALREKSGLTQKELADRLGTHQSMIARLEKNVPKLGPTFETLARITKACGYKMALRFETVAEAEKTASMAPIIEAEFSEGMAGRDIPPHARDISEVAQMEEDIREELARLGVTADTLRDEEACYAIPAGSLVSLLENAITKAAADSGGVLAVGPDIIKGIEMIVSSCRQRSNDYQPVGAAEPAVAAVEYR